MRRSFHTTIEEIKDFDAMDVEIEFDFTPEEKPVPNNYDGSGYPGSPPEAELVSVIVHKWLYEDDEFSRKDGTIFKGLDLIAEAIVRKRWEDLYRDQCIEAVEAEAAERE